MRSGEEGEVLDGEGSHVPMVSGASSPYQSTTEPVYSGGVFRNLTCNTHYLTSRPGILKILQTVLSLMGFVSIETVTMCSPCAGVYLFEFVSCSAFIITGGLLLVFSLDLHIRVHQINWRHVDLMDAVFSTLMFFIASVVLAALDHQSGAEMASVIFGFVVTAVYGANMYVRIGRWRTGDPLQSSEYTPSGQVATGPE